MQRMVCFCFGYTEWDIREDYRKNGHSLILGQITRMSAEGKCRCLEKNPRKT